MSVFVANFGRENYEWPQCKSGSYVATMQDERLHHLWEAGDRQAYIAEAIQRLRTAKGVTPVKGTASRWFNLGTIIMESAGDVWVHRDGSEIWWTKTTNSGGWISLEADPKPTEWGSKNVYFYRKPSQPWSAKDAKGNPLNWNAIHPKAHDFLTTEATLQKLSHDYANYVLELIAGGDLRPWHNQPKWKAKTEIGRRSMPVSFANARQKTVLQMAARAQDTARVSNGQRTERRLKNKEFRFETRLACEKYLNELYDAQEGLCALSGLQLQWTDGDDPELCCSLDRIDSNGHYEAGNLQIVCKFINRWKSDGDDMEFRRLLALVDANN